MSMTTHRENLLSVINGETVERLRWVLRIDLWYNPQETRGTNPARFEGMVVEDIHRWLHGGIPETLLLEKSLTWEDLETFMDSC